MVMLFDDASQFDPHDNWLAQAGIVDQPSSNQYFTALYFSITTLTTIGYGDISPVSFWERNVWIIMGISGAIMYAGIFGTVTAQVQKLDSLRSGLTDELQTIGTFCKLYDIPLESEMKLLSYRRHQWDATKGLQIEKVLSDLPFELVTEIKVCLYKEDILKISYFTDVGDTFIRAIVPFIKPSVCMAGDYIVRQGDPATELYCLKTGVANVLICVEGDFVDDGFIGMEEVEVVNTIKTGEMFGNIGLLLKSNHRMASVQARTFCELWSLSRDAFDFVMPDFPGVQKRIVAHALHCLDRDLKNQKLNREAIALIKKSVAELENQMKEISEKLVRRRVSCMSQQKRMSQQHRGSTREKSHRKSSRSSLSSFFGLKSILDEEKTRPQKTSSTVDIVREMRLRADRRASEQGELNQIEKTAADSAERKTPTSQDKRTQRRTRFAQARTKRLATATFINSLKANSTGIEGNMTRKKMSPTSERRRSLVSNPLMGGSLEARQQRKSAVGNTFGPPGLQSATSDAIQKDIDRKHTEVMSRISGLEEKLDALLDNLGTSPSGFLKNRMEDCASEAVESKASEGSEYNNSGDECSGADGVLRVRKIYV